MPDIGAGKPDRREIRRLERQQRHQMVVPARHAPRAAGAPRPDHRRDIVNERQGLALAAQPLRDAPGEARAVDGDERHGLLRDDIGDRLGDAAEDAARLRQHLGDAHDRELGQGHAAVQALRRHGLAADPGEAHLAARALAQGRHQLAAEEIARRLAGDEIDERRRRAHAALTPTTKIPARSAASITASRSSTSAAPASTAMPRNPRQRRRRPWTDRSSADRRGAPGRALPSSPARRPASGAALQ